MSKQEATTSRLMSPKPLLVYRQKSRLTDHLVELHLRYMIKQVCEKQNDEIFLPLPHTSSVWFEIFQNFEMLVEKQTT